MSIFDSELENLVVSVHEIHGEKVLGDALERALRKVAGTQGVPVSSRGLECLGIDINDATDVEQVPVGVVRPPRTSRGDEHPRSPRFRCVIRPFGCSTRT